MNRVQTLSTSAPAASTISGALLKATHPSFQKVTLNRPNSLNALDIELLRALRASVQTWQNDDSPRIVLFEGAGDRAFSTGGDIKRFYNAIKFGDKQYIPEFLVTQNAVCYELAVMKPLQIAIWNGFVMGAGVGISVNSKIKIATEKTRFAVPEVKNGFWADAGAGFFLSRLRGSIGYYLGVTGRTLVGPEVVEVGLADYYVKSENLKLIESRLIQISPKNPSLEELQNIIKGYSEPLVPYLVGEDKIRKYFDKNNLDDIYKHLKNDETASQFAQQTVKEIEEGSPLCVKLTFEQIKRGSIYSLKQNYAMDLKVNQKIEHVDLFEGVRCRLVDRWDKPKWSHKSLLDVSQEEVAKYFA